MVGRSPFGRAKTTTTINVVLVPVIVNIGPSTFDPTAVNACFAGGTHTDVDLVQNSPMFQNVPWTMNGISIGTGQHIDAFRRAEFWSLVSGSNYHTNLSLTTLAAQTMPTSVAAGATTFSSGCGLLGITNINLVDNWLKTVLIPALGISPTTFPIFLMHNVVMSTDGTLSGCCVLGFHGATGNPVQTYSPFDFDTTGDFANTSDISVMTHEVGEWLEDPLGTNPTPRWGNIGQVSTCTSSAGGQTNLEVGDPLSGTIGATLTATPFNGVLYHMQELAFFSWFFDGATHASLGAGGKYSDNGTFTGASGVCPPGGTLP